MSSEKTELAQSSSKTPRQRPTASIARSIAWGYWWRKLVRLVFYDAFFIAALGAAFTWHCSTLLPSAALDGIVIGNGKIPLISPTHWGFTGEGLKLSTWAYNVYGGDGITYSYPVMPFIMALLPFLMVALIWQVFWLFDFFKDTRRVRRQLQPLNDLAVMADTLSRVGVTDPMASLDDSSKIETLEQAIARASVDSPMVQTGDKDLRSIEVALNGLLKQMQEAKLQQMRFVSDASHELRTPIAVIQGYVNMLDRWGSSDEEILHESIDALKAESEHMQELVEQLLFLARGDSGRNTLQKAPMNMASMMLEVLDESTMIDTAHTYSCSITEEAANDNRYMVSGDVAMLKQVMRIIVQNAEKYSPEGSTITLGVLQDDASVSCTIQDEGMGMSEEDASHIFERFYRSESARSQGMQGSGLGLSIAKWIVDAHGGSIEVLSREGVGTRFTVRLPRSE